MFNYSCYWSAIDAEMIQSIITAVNVIILVLVVGMVENSRIFQLRCKIQNYDWGMLGNKGIVGKFARLHKYQNIDSIQCAEVSLPDKFTFFSFGLGLILTDFQLLKVISHIPKWI